MVAFSNMFQKQENNFIMELRKETLLWLWTMHQMVKAFVPLEKIILFEFMMSKLKK